MEQTEERTDRLLTNHKTQYKYNFNRKKTQGLLLNVFDLRFRPIKPEFSAVKPVS